MLLQLTSATLRSLLLICDSCVFTTRDKCYSNLRQLKIHDSTETWSDRHDIAHQVQINVEEKCLISLIRYFANPSDHDVR